MAATPPGNNWGSDPMLDPRIPFPMIMLLVGMIVVAAVGMAVQSRRADQGN